MAVWHEKPPALRAAPEFDVGQNARDRCAGENAGNAATVIALTGRMQTCRMPAWTPDLKIPPTRHAVAVPASPSCATRRGMRHRLACRALA